MASSLSNFRANTKYDTAANTPNENPELSRVHNQNKFYSFLNELLISVFAFFLSLTLKVTQYPSSISREIQPWPSRFQRPSDLYKVVVTNSQHPPLMQDRSWSLAVPYKEQRYFHTPSESIANNYTPTANKLQIKNLSQSVKTLKRDYVVLKPSKIELAEN